MGLSGNFHYDSMMENSSLAGSMEKALKLSWDEITIISVGRKKHIYLSTACSKNDLTAQNWGVSWVWIRPGK